MYNLFTQCWELMQNIKHNDNKLLNHINSKQLTTSQKCEQHFQYYKKIHVYIKSRGLLNLIDGLRFYASRKIRRMFAYKDKW